MTRSRMTALLVAVLFSSLVLVRFIPARAACGVTIVAYRSLNNLQLDDELPAVSLRVARILFTPNDAPVYECVIKYAIAHERRPNDLLIFALATYTAEKMSKTDSRRLFLELAGPLRTADCDRMYLVAALLPLAPPNAAHERGDLISAYASIGRPPDSMESDAERCEAYRHAIDQSLQLDH